VFLAAVALAAGGGCLFTDPINMPPHVTIDKLSAPIARREPVTFTATASDPNGDVPGLRWAHQPVCGDVVTSGCGSCPGPGADLARDGVAPAPGPMKGPSYEVPGQDGPFCVWVFATDKHGAVSYATYLVTPRNQLPVARITVVSPNREPPYERYKEIELSWAESSDPDDAPEDLEAAWTLDSPTGTADLNRPCAKPRDDKSKCFLPDPDGPYQVKLTVTDKHGDKNMQTKTIQVQPDRLPCLRVTTPMLSESFVIPLDGAASAMKFVVEEVDDDGDPYPAAATLKFRWFEGPASAPPVDRGPSSLGEYTVRDFYSLGDRAKVRVEIVDRNVDKVAQVLSNCGESDTCAGAPNCLQRMTWTIQY
jgi:hypothetical protein